MIRLSLCLSAFALVAAACGGEQAAGPDTSGDCVALLVWNGVTYEGAAVEEPPTLGKEIGEAVIPPCGTSPRRKVGVARIAGVHPSIALVAPGPEDAYPDSGLVWLGAGYPATSPRHPFHEEVVAAGGAPDASDGFECGGERVVRARARTTPGAFAGYVEVTADDQTTEAFLRRDDVDGIVTLDSRSDVRGFDRHGVPFIAAGDEFELTLRECVGRKDVPGLAGLRRLLVDRLRP